MALIIIRRVSARELLQTEKVFLSPSTGTLGSLTLFWAMVIFVHHSDLTANLARSKGCRVNVCVGRVTLLDPCEIVPTIPKLE